jgi:hypothetical protein
MHTDQYSQTSQKFNSCLGWPLGIADLLHRAASQDQVQGPQRQCETTSTHGWIRLPERPCKLCQVWISSNELAPRASSACAGLKCFQKPRPGIQFYLVKSSNEKPLPSPVFSASQVRFIHDFSRRWRLNP